MKQTLLLIAFFLLCGLAYAQCPTCGNDPTTGGLACNDNAVGACKCGVHYLGHGRYSCVQCGFCTFGCTVTCNPQNCDPTIDPTCGPTSAGAVMKTANTIYGRVALQSQKMADVLTALGMSGGCQLTKGKLRDENTKTQDDWVMFVVSNGWIIQMGSETLGVLTDHWFLSRQDLPVITEAIVLK